MHVVSGNNTLRKHLARHTEIRHRKCILSALHCITNDCFKSDTMQLDLCKVRTQLHVQERQAIKRTSSKLKNSNFKNVPGELLLVAKQFSINICFTISIQKVKWFIQFLTVQTIGYTVYRLQRYHHKFESLPVIEVTESSWDSFCGHFSCSVAVTLDLWLSEALDATVLRSEISWTEILAFSVDGGPRNYKWSEWTSCCDWHDTNNAVQLDWVRGIVQFE